MNSIDYLLYRRVSSSFRMQSISYGSCYFNFIKITPNFTSKGVKLGAYFVFY